MSLVAGLLVALVVGCGGKKNVEDEPLLTPDELYRQARELLERGKTHQAIEIFQSIDFRFAGQDRQRLEPLVRLSIADATFYQGTTLALIDARSRYLEFVTLFGDHELAPYAQFQAGVCSLEQANHPARDQSQTHAAFEDLREVERRYSNSRFALAARDMIRKAQRNLAEHEYLVGRFYFNRKSYVAAAERFRKVLNEFPEYDDREKIYFFLGQSLLLDDHDVEGKIYLDKLVTDFPNGEYVDLARKALSQAGELELGLK